MSAESNSLLLLNGTLDVRGDKVGGRKIPRNKGLAVTTLCL